MPRYPEGKQCNFCLKDFTELIEYKPKYILWLTCSNCFGKNENKYIKKYYKGAKQ